MARMDAVLQKSVDDVDRRAEKLGLGPNRLSDRLASMEDHLEVEVGDDRAGCADVVSSAPGFVASCVKGLVQHLQSTEYGTTPPVEARRRSHGEDRVALELGDREVRLNPFDHSVEQFAQNGKPGRDTNAEVNAMLALDAGHEGGVARYVGQQKVPLRSRRDWLCRLRHCRRRSYVCQAVSTSRDACCVGVIPRHATAHAPRTVLSPISNEHAPAIATCTSSARGSGVRIKGHRRTDRGHPQGFSTTTSRGLAWRSNPDWIS
jgi:hypothetical protein